MLWGASAHALQANDSATATQDVLRSTWATLLPVWGVDQRLLPRSPARLAAVYPGRTCKHHNCYTASGGLPWGFYQLGLYLLSSTLPTDSTVSHG